MPRPATILPPDTLEYIMDRAARGRVGLPGDSPLYVPAPRDLEAAIDTVFWTMQSQEEGRSALSRLRFTDVFDPFCRIEPAPLTTETLRKLPPLLDVPENWLLVDRENRVVGVSAGQLMGLEVAATSRGDLVISRLHAVIALLEAGTWHHVDGGRPRVLQLLQPAFDLGGFPARLTAASIVLDFAMWARSQRRGAAFVLTPSPETIGLLPKYPIETFPAAATLIERLRSPPTEAIDLSEGAQAYEALQMAVEAQEAQVALAVSVISAGAGIDGATLLDSKTLLPLGFGAKIEFTRDDFEVSLIELPAAVARLVKKKDLGGMRHQSAAGLVYANHEVTVITVSQDGTISLFAWLSSDQRVVVLKHIDRHLAAEPLRVLRPA